MESYYRITGSCVSRNIYVELKDFNYGFLSFRGGLSPGDIVTHINKKEIKTSSDVYEALADNSKTLDITIFRGPKRLTLTITPEDP